MDNMRRVAFDGFWLWQFDHLAAEKEINHFVTDRSSARTEAGFTLSFSSHPDREYIRLNRLRLANAIGVLPQRLFLPSQVHGDRIVNVTSETTTAELMETDALVTTEKGVCIAVMSADCVPILLYDPHNRVVAAVHSGWRGTVRKILAKTVAYLQDHYQSEPHRILAGIGPSVCQDSYEVGGEVIEQVAVSFPGASHLMIPTDADKAKLDLWEANKIQLLHAGVGEENIRIANLCTVIHNEWFFSARKGDKGRFAAGIVLR